MYIARNKNGSLYFYDERPTRSGEHFVNTTGRLTVPISPPLSISRDFINCTWENSPFKLVLTKD